MAQAAVRVATKWGIVMNFEAERSIPTLLSDVFGKLAKLISNEFDLAKAELSEKASQLARAAAMIGVGALLMLPAFVMLLFAVAAWLMHAGVSDPVAYLLTGAGTAAIAGSLVAVGMKRLSGEAMKPKIMIEQLQQDKIAAQEMVR
jgi:Putative Actinobacterial Holin-X, holin superfamily III